MAKKYWVAKAFSKNKGSLRRSLKAKKGHNIPSSKLRSAAKRGGKIGKRARLAQTARGFRHRGRKRR